jgi:hypothetical protein
MGYHFQEFLFPAIKIKIINNNSTMAGSLIVLQIPVKFNGPVVPFEFTSTV